MINLASNSNPCKGCKERTIGCHGTCMKYKTWQEKHLKAKRAFRNQRYQKGIGYLGDHYRKPSKCKGGKE